MPLGAEIVAAVAALRKVEGATTDDLRAQLPGLPAARSGRGFEARLAALSDALLATFFATRGFPADLRGLQDIYRVYHLPASEEGDPQPLAQFLARSLLAPSITRKDESVTPPPRVPTPEPGADRAALTTAISELVRMDRRELLVQPDERGGAVGNTLPFTLTAAARKAVSRETQAVLKAQGVDLAETPIDTAVQRLFVDKWLVPARKPHWPRPVVTPQPGVTLPPAPGVALVQPAGVADLLVVKQQIKRYEGAEIAHIENVLIGEKKSRAHRQLERSEETVLNETESTRSSETEVQTTDRFELNRESSRTIQNDHNLGSIGDSFPMIMAQELDLAVWASPIGYGSEPGGEVPTNRGKVKVKYTGKFPPDLEKDRWWRVSWFFRNQDRGAKFYADVLKARIDAVDFVEHKKSWFDDAKRVATASVEKGPFDSPMDLQRRLTERIEALGVA